MNIFGGHVFSELFFWVINNSKYFWCFAHDDVVWIANVTKLICLILLKVIILTVCKISFDF